MSPKFQAYEIISGEFKLPQDTSTGSLQVFVLDPATSKWSITPTIIVREPTTHDAAFLWGLNVRLAGIPEKPAQPTINQDNGLTD